MTDYTLFGDTTGPATGADPEGPLNLSHLVTVTTTCWVKGLRFYRPADVTGTITGRLWQRTGPGTGTPVGSDLTFDLGADAGWKTALFAEPIELALGTYKPTVHLENRWPITSGYWEAGGLGENGLTAGPLTAPNAATSPDGQGSFSTGPLTTFPNIPAANKATYWVDLLVTDIDPEGGPEVADYTIAADEIGIHAVPLVAATASTFTFADDVSEVVITNMTGAAPIYYTLDGSTPTVAGTKTRLIPADVTSVEVEPTGSGPTVVKLISPGTPTVSVARSS